MTGTTDVTVDGGRLIVVSNRLPLTLRRTGDGWRAESSSGGLATALGPCCRGPAGCGSVARRRPRRLRERKAELLRAGSESTATWRWISRRGGPALLRGLRQPDAVAALPPLPLALHFDATGWDAYVEANRRFRDAVLRESSPGDLRLGPRLPAHAPAADAARGRPRHRQSASSCTSPSPPPTCSASCPAGGDAARPAGRRPRRFPDPRRPAALPVLRCSASWASTAAWTAWRRTAASSRLEVLAHRHRPRGVRAGPPRGPAAQEALAGAPPPLHGPAGSCSRWTGSTTPRGSPTACAPSAACWSAHRLARQGGAGAGGGARRASASRMYESCAKQVNGLVGEINGEFGTAAWTPVVYIHRGRRARSWWRSTPRPTSAG